MKKEGILTGKAQNLTGLKHKNFYKFQIKHINLNLTIKNNILCLFIANTDE